MVDVVLEQDRPCWCRFDQRRTLSEGICIFWAGFEIKKEMPIPELCGGAWKKHPAVKEESHERSVTSRAPTRAGGAQGRVFPSFFPAGHEGLLFFSSKQQDNNRKNLWCADRSGNWAAVSCSFWNNFGMIQNCILT